MILARRFMFTFLIACMLVGCTQKPVTVDQQPVADPALQNVGRALAAADATAASIAHFLLAGFRSGVVSREVLVTYADTIGPLVQTALNDARDLSVTMARTPGAVSSERVQQALTALTQAVQQAVAFATTHGYKGN